MYFYWRIMHELRYLGETLVFTNPSFKREFHQWRQRNRAGLALAVMEVEKPVFDAYDPFDIKPSLN